MKEPIILRRLERGDETAFLRAVESWTDSSFSFGGSLFVPGVDFSTYRNLIEQYEQGRDLPSDRVPDTYLFGFLDDQIVGRLSIRHYLNEYLARRGGHIGYGVLADFRGRGFAKSMLRQALPIAKNLDIRRVLITCDDDNIGSYRVIESCGGILEKVVLDDDGVRRFRRYWIEL